MLDQATLNFLRDTIAKNLDSREYKAFIFGSRVIGNSRKWSDIDLGIIGHTPLPAIKSASLNEIFENSNLPYRVDLVDFTHVTDRFRQLALKNTLYLN